MWLSQNRERFKCAHRGHVTLCAPINPALGIEHWASLENGPGSGRRIGPGRRFHTADKAFVVCSHFFCYSIRSTNLNMSVFSGMP